MSANFANYKNKILIFILLLLASTLPFSASLNFPLLQGWDDHIYVLNNLTRLELNLENFLYWFRTPCEGCYLPLVMISYMFDYAIGGTDGFVYHLQNLLWHFTAVLGVYTLFRQMGMGYQISLICAIFYAVHPQRVESVVWVSERKDVMCGTFYFWAINFFIFSESDCFCSKTKKGLWLLSLLFAIFAFLSKPMAVSLPFIILFTSYYLNSGFSKNILLKLLPFFLLALLSVPVAIFSQDIPTVHMNFLRRLLVVILNVPWYFGKTFLPNDLSPIYPRIILSGSRIVWTLIFYLSLLTFFYQLIKRGYFALLSSVLILFLCFFISLLPVSGLVPIGAIDYADRYSYIPSIFLIILFAGFVEFLRIKFALRKFLFLILYSYVLVLAFISYFYSFAWSSYRALLETAFTHKPPAYIVLSALADLEFFTGDKSRVVELARIAREREIGWESKGGVERVIFKLDALVMHYYYQTGRIKDSAKIANQILNLDLKKLITNDTERENFFLFLNQIIRESEQ